MVSQYQARKARMDRDPEYKDRILRAQQESRRNRREREHQEALAIGAACPHLYPNGRRCWKGYAHTHGGIEIDPMKAEIVSPG